MCTKNADLELSIELSGDVLSTFAAIYVSHGQQAFCIHTWVKTDVSYTVQVYMYVAHLCGTGLWSDLY